MNLLTMTSHTATAVTAARRRGKHALSQQSLAAPPHTAAALKRALRRWADATADVERSLDTELDDVATLLRTINRTDDDAAQGLTRRMP
ncbi:hypothetical protein H0194_04390 [Corynebacterium incognita]|uniref:Uncharacterized protein n=1 Tax=Corynebacterium incognita TaxID=2754725 RepID=A0A7G7CRK9_9CORY|nr:hypothetical protein [Corynebacterium incognita]QNE90225.1 hypothetical protein H0194_04390 [Corynebacterium incognita]